MAKPAHHSAYAFHGARQRLILLAVLLLLVYVLAPQISGFSESWQALAQANFAYVLLAIACTALTYFIAAAMYQLLAKRRLALAKTLQVQMASGFVNRLLPAGLGGLTLNVQYLRKAKHTLPEALAVAGMNNTLASITHLALLVLIMVVSHDALPESFTTGHISSAAYVIAGIMVLALACLLTFSRLRRKLYALSNDVIHQFSLYRKNLFRLFAASLSAALLAIAYAAVLYCSARAIGVTLDPLQAFIIFSVGVLAGTVTPTPGGVVGAEAGLAGALVAYDVPAASAIAIALLYRLVTYWLPMVPGFVMFLAIRKKYL